jgi:sensor histidine kinase YesM
MTTKYMTGIEEDKGLRNFISIHMLQNPFIFSDERRYRIRRHLAFWLFWWAFQGFLYSFIAINSAAAYARQLPISMMESLVFMTAHMFMAYALMYFVIPRFLLKQKYWQTAMGVVGTIVVTAMISTTLALTVIPSLRECIMGVHYNATPRTTGGRIFLSLMAGLRGAITIGGLAAAIKLMKYWYLKEQRNLQLQKENIESQLQLLKAQVHPHFLFNTLNNIYSHTQNSSPVAAKMVGELSGMLRFILYESNQSLVPLAKELKLIRDYIGLENIRYSSELDLHIDLPEKTDDLHIAPLLLLPLVENCFKHGTSKMLEQPWISLQIILYGTTMQMKLLNGKTDKEKNDPVSSGIGIQNVQKRLALLYPGKHQLTITSDEDVFIVNLKIELEQVAEAKTRTKLTALLQHDGQ